MEKALINADMKELLYLSCDFSLIITEYMKDKDLKICVDYLKTRKKQLDSAFDDLMNDVKGE